MSNFEIDISEVRQFCQHLSQTAKGDFKKELTQWLEAIGEDFLRVVQDEIIRRKVVDTSLLLGSFHKGGEGNIWRMSDGDLTLEVGSSVDYAGYVEYGHPQEPGRFIPGHWEGNRFIYVPGAKEGMVLKSNWVNGKHYFESALRIYDAMFPKMVEAKMDEWLSKFLNF